MIRLSKKADYGLIAATHLARFWSVGWCSAKDIADAYLIPPPLMAKILQRMVKDGILVSQHGINGGYSLARPPEKITAFEIIAAIDGPVQITSCVTTKGECYQSPRCNVREPLRKVNERVINVLSEVTLSGMNDSLPGLVGIQGVL